MPDCCRVKQGARIGAPHGACEHWQCLLPEPGFHIFSRLDTGSKFGGFIWSQVAANWDQPGYSGLNQDKRVNIFFKPATLIENRRFVIRRQDFSADQRNQLRPEAVSSHVETRVNTLKYAYARMNTGSRKFFSARTLKSMKSNSAHFAAKKKTCGGAAFKENSPKFK
jgi:hypothetical protein